MRSPCGWSGIPKPAGWSGRPETPCVLQSKSGQTQAVSPNTANPAPSARSPARTTSHALPGRYRYAACHNRPGGLSQGGPCHGPSSRTPCFSAHSFVPSEGRPPGNHWIAFHHPGQPGQRRCSPLSLGMATAFGCRLTCGSAAPSGARRRLQRGVRRASGEGQTA